VIEPTYDILIAGWDPAALSLAQAAQGAGVERVAVLAPGSTVVPHRAVGKFRLEIHYHATINAVSSVEDEQLEVATPYRRYRTRTLVVSAEDQAGEPWVPIPPSLANRVHAQLDPKTVRGLDVLVAGAQERAAAAAIFLAEAGANVVIAFESSSIRISPLARQELVHLEAERRLTVLLAAPIHAIEDLTGNPMVFFESRTVPDLEFDHVLLVADPEKERLPAVVEGFDHSDPRVFALFDSGRESDSRDLDPVDGFVKLSAARFPDVTTWRQPLVSGWVGGDTVSELESRLYNATITKFNAHHSDLWILRVKPDQGDVSFVPGQYATLGLGYWEPRIDNAYEDLTEEKRRLVIRRSYSISSPMFDESGLLVDHSRSEQLEFYIVLVRPSAEEIPGLTPRLALKEPGDRIFLGTKVTGRYTLERVRDPNTAVVFCATGTGEAPHNAMLAELLRRGHPGPILNAVSVRYMQDLAYLEKHRILEARYSHYRYLTLVTREPGVEKVRLQDALDRGMFEETIGDSLTPDHTHFFLCGNPAMIGLPEWEGDNPKFPTTRGMCEMLTERGFVVDRRAHPGNVHFEEYW
jgi:ferredoxin--NADP+ reductase